MFGYAPVQLKDIVSIERGKRVVRKQLTDSGDYAVYQNSLKPLGYYGEANCKGEKTFVIAAGAAGDVGYSYDDFWAADDCYYFECSDLVIERFLYHVLQNSHSQISSKVRKASIPRIGRTAIENIQLTIPTVEEQNRVINILDRFDKLCNDISEGLPAEIEARKKQYEFYRDKLLTFKEVKI